MEFFDEENSSLLSQLRMIETDLDENSRYINYARLLLPIFNQAREERKLSLKLVVRHMIVLGEQDPAMERVHHRLLNHIIGSVDNFGIAADRLEMWIWILNELMGHCGALFVYETIANACRGRAALFYEEQWQWGHSRELKLSMTFQNVETRETDEVNVFGVYIDISFYSLLLRDLGMFESYIKKAISLERPFTDSVQHARYHYLVGRYMDLTLHFGDAAIRFIYLSRSPILLSTDYHLMVLAIVNTMLIPDRKLYYSLLNLIAQNSSWCSVPELSDSMPFLVKVMTGVPISESDLQEFTRFMQPHQLQPGVNGTPPLIAAMIRHNICACGLITHLSQVRAIAHRLGMHESHVIAIMVEMMGRGELRPRWFRKVRTPIFPPPIQFLSSVRTKTWIDIARTNLVGAVVRDLGRDVYPYY